MRRREGREQGFGKKKKEEEEKEAPLEPCFSLSLSLSLSLFNYQLVVARRFSRFLSLSPNLLSSERPPPELSLTRSILPPPPPPSPPIPNLPPQTQKAEPRRPLPRQTRRLALAPAARRPGPGRRGAPPPGALLLPAHAEAPPRHHRATERARARGLVERRDRAAPVCVSSFECRRQLIVHVLVTSGRPRWYR